VTTTITSHRTLLRSISFTTIRARAEPTMPPIAMPTVDFRL
jgi:hypothetical protein